MFRIKDDWSKQVSTSSQLVLLCQRVWTLRDLLEHLVLGRCWFINGGNLQLDGPFQGFSPWSLARRSAGWLLLCICFGLWGKKHVDPVCSTTFQETVQPASHWKHNVAQWLTTWKCVHVEIIKCEYYFIAVVTGFTCTPAPVYSAWWLHLDACGLRTSPGLPKPGSTDIFLHFQKTCTPPPPLSY